MRVKHILIFLLFIMLIGCREFSPVGFGSRERAIAKVEDKELYMSDVIGIFNNNMTKEDSVKILKAHVDNWIKKEIKIRQAEQILEENQDDIEALIEDYRNTLLTYKYDNMRIRDIDTTISMDQIRRYYEENKNMFRLVSPIVKGRVIKYSADYRQDKKLRDAFKSEKEADYFDLIDIINKNEFKIEEYAYWTYFKELLQHIPFSNKDFDKFLRDKKAYEVSDEESKYIMFITDYKLTGDYAPLSMVENTIRHTLITKRKADQLKIIDDSVYKKAIEGELISIDTNLINLRNY